MAPRGESRRNVAIGAAFALPIGVLSGFTGVGGGEYRAPVLMALMGKVRWSIAANLLVGILVSGFNVVLRRGWTLPYESLLLAFLLSVASLPGAYVGARATNWTSTRSLKLLLAAILIATGLRLVLFETRAGGAPVSGSSGILLACIVGFALGTISGLFGLAGGEYRIPALILLFGVPPIDAGTLSSLASIPPQLVGFAKHRRLEHTGAVTYRLGAAMGLASAAGVAIGVVLLGRTTEALVAQLLGAVMVVAAGTIIRDVYRSRGKDEPPDLDGPKR